MRNIKDIIQGNVTDCIILPDGSRVPMNYKQIAYDSKLDLNTGDYLNISEGEYFTSTLPTINVLIQTALVQKSSLIREYDVSFDSSHKKELMELSEDEFLTRHVPAIRKEFAEHGFTVSIKAILHNFNCWQRDFKSGYRDETCHLFSPCGCNNLRFSASELDERCSDWQTTYFG